MKTSLKLFAIALLAFAGLAQAQGSFTIEQPSQRNSRSGWYTTIPVRLFPTYVNARVLAANTAENVSVPATARFAVFSSTCNFHARADNTATVPAGDVDNGTASEMNPAAWYFNPGQVAVISVIASAACTVTISFGI